MTVYWETLNSYKNSLEGKIWYGACFTSQQAVEKALKAYLISQEKDIKKIHDLRALLEECIKSDQSFESLRNECVALNTYYIPSRYPDLSEFIHFTKEKSEEAYKFAKEITSFVKDKIQ
ncbi:MAG: HEPN domain-containing protein [Candidatus Daviesbacteria bacterium]|nr:HEPN domain-containing protein [Candidatus Daviesbacteria bacterium]